VLARLWGALSRESVPGVMGRRDDGRSVTITLTDGRTVRASAATAAPFAIASAGFAVTVDGAKSTAHTDPAELVRDIAPPLGPNADRLASELDNSVANLALARSAQPSPDGGPVTLARAANERDPLVYLEQSVVDGHPLHPCARTRMGLTEAEVRAYAPEHRPVVRLQPVAVSRQRWYGFNGPPMLWMHPWQYARMREEHPWLTPNGPEILARPLMSLRTLALDPFSHVKTAVDIQMTSAVRTISPASVHNGPTLSRLLLALADRVPGLAILPEVSGGAVMVAGEPDRRLAVIHRRGPLLAKDELVMPLAVLAAPSPATGTPIVTELVDAAYGGDPLAFVEGLAFVLLPPVLELLKLGIALEAHGQNLLGVVHFNPADPTAPPNGRFTRIIYRDFGGVRVSAARLRQHGIEPPPLRGDIPNDDPEVLRTKVFASAISTVLGEVIAVLARCTGMDPDKAWHQVAAVARGVTGPDTAAVFAPTLPLKATTAMRLADDAVADIWTQQPNPLAGLR
jgi:siderophore synthetase component